MIKHELNTVDFLLLMEVMRKIDGDHITNVNQIDEQVCMATIRPTVLDRHTFSQWYTLEFDSVRHQTLFNLKYGTNYS